MKRILFQGDSVTDAGRSRENDKILGFGYATMVAAQLGFEYPDEYEFLNRGSSGNRITDMMARMKEDIINLKPDVMSILIGVNDVGREVANREGVDAERYGQLYAMIVEDVKTRLPDIKIMILEPFATYGTLLGPWWEDARRELATHSAAAERVAKRYGLSWVPLQKLFDDAMERVSPEYWLSDDGVHPTYAGHELIKREWLKAFSQL